MSKLYVLRLVALFAAYLCTGTYGVAISYSMIEPLLNCYTRSITVLEIQSNGSGCITPAIAAKYPGTCVAMVSTNAEFLINTIRTKNLQTLVVTQPPTISASMLETLGRCEHFDLVIVHEPHKIGKKSVSHNLPLLLRLADHVCIALPEEHTLSLENISCPYEIPSHEQAAVVYLFHPGKDAIQQPRWNKRTSSQKYHIKSTFNHKTLHKNDTTEGSQWAPGINLITFVMLNGLYPTDAIIREHLEAFYEITHNDLVIGNMVVQGSHIATIDAHDKRRYLDQRLCLKAARILFSWNRRFKDPEYELYKYSHYIQARNKNKRGR